MQLSRTVEWLWIGGACLLLHLFYASVQPVTRTHDGLAYDGQHYFSMAQQTPRQLPPQAPAPFVYRLGTPMAAAAIAKSNDWVLAEGFDLVNRAASVVTVLLFAVWLQRHLPSAPLRILMILFFMIAPHLPMRFAYLYPINVDSAALMFMMAGLVALDLLEDQWTRGLLLLTGVVAGGVIFREIVLVIGLAAAVRHVAVTRNRRRWLAVLPLLAGVVVYSAVRAWVVPAPAGYDEMTEILHWLRQKSVIQVVLAWLLTFGPALLLPLCSAKASMRHLVERPDWAVVVGAVGVLAIVGGSDTERLLVFAAPVIFLVIGRAWAATDFGLTSAPAFILVLAQLLNARIFLPLGTWTTPHVTGTEWNRVPSLVQWLSTYDSLWTQFCGPEAIRYYLLWFGALTVFTAVAVRKPRIVAAPPASAHR